MLEYAFKEVKKIMNEEIKEEKIDLKESLQQARKLCPSMSQYMYMLTDYVATYLDRPLSVKEFFLKFYVVVYIIDGCDFFYHPITDIKFPKEICINKDEILNQVPYFPHIISKITPQEYSSEFNEIFKEKFKRNLPKPPKNNFRTKLLFKPELDDYPEFIIAAVEWWAERINKPLFLFDPRLPLELAYFQNQMIQKAKRASYYQAPERHIQYFKEVLSFDLYITTVMKGKPYKLGGDYDLDDMLKRACSCIGTRIIVPWHTIMSISSVNESVKVYFNGEWQIIYDKKSSPRNIRIKS